MIPTIIRHAVNGTPVPLYGDGMQIRDWLFAEDHCRAIKLVLEKEHSVTFTISAAEMNGRIKSLRHLS